jgi:hypothetical protein
VPFQFSTTLLQHFQNVHFSVFICYIYSVYQKCFDKFQEWVLHTKTGKNVVEMCGYKHLVFQVLTNNVLTHVRPSGCCLWGNVETSSVFSSNCKHLKTFSVTIQLRTLRDFQHIQLQLGTLGIFQYIQLQLRTLRGPQCIQLQLGTLGEVQCIQLQLGTHRVL